VASWSRSRNLTGTPRSLRSIAAVLACCVTHAESGRAVTPAATTRLVLSWMKNSTYNVCNQLVSTVKKSQATIPSAWARRNCAQLGPERRGAGPRPQRRSSV
jgi:hypothetical protein